MGPGQLFKVFLVVVFGVGWQGSEGCVLIGGFCGKKFVTALTLNCGEGGGGPDRMLDGKQTGHFRLQRSV